MEIQIVADGKELPEVRVNGEIDLYTCADLRAALQSLVESGQSRIILDMRRVPYIDSAALGVLVDVQRRVKEQDGGLYLAGMAPFVQRAFDITRLVRLFSIHSTAEEAAEAARDGNSEAAGGER